MTLEEVIDDLVSANRILYAEGVVDGFGHVSARHPEDPSRFLLSRSMAPGLVAHEDMMEFDLEGNPIDARGRQVFLERYIHSEIYRARPDAQSIVHSHSTALIPFGVTATRLRPVFHMTGFLGVPAPVFEIRTAGGDDTDMLIRTPALGAALAVTLGEAPFALMRGHGAVAVGASIKQVVYRAIYADMNARLQSDAMRLGEVTYLNDHEAARASAASDRQLDRPWALWKRKIGATDR